MSLKPSGREATRWTPRDMARAARVSHNTDHRIWQVHALQRHRVATFKLTRDREVKIHDVVGVYPRRRRTPWS